MPCPLEKYKEQINMKLAMNWAGHDVSFNELREAISAVEAGKEHQPDFFASDFFKAIHEYKDNPEEFTKGALDKAREDCKLGGVYNETATMAMSMKSRRV